MKKIEAIVQSEVSKQVVNAIRNIGIEGVTLIQSLGQGEGERPKIGGRQIEFNSTDVVMTVIPDSKVREIIADTQEDEVISIIKKNGRVGKIFVSQILRAVDIASEEEGESTI
ncbi:MAG: P-II family nitrogen regulator [Nitrosopumilus sp.]|nr:P-II family nitrogen regulator [Nitrosopumilus sp.]MDH5658074.1 P-II family nitrogen regulator [Nitrosopumilus sp.]